MSKDQGKVEIKWEKGVSVSELIKELKNNAAATKIEHICRLQTINGEIILSSSMDEAEILKAIKEYKKQLMLSKKAPLAQVNVDQSKKDLPARTGLTRRRKIGCVNKSGKSGNKLTELIDLSSTKGSATINIEKEK